MAYEFPVDLEWEFPRDNLILGSTLGEGAFGKVVRAEAFGIVNGSYGPATVAVKMLKEGHSEDDLKDFVCEIEVMKMIGKHPSIINLLGCCYANGPLYALIEFAVHGNLKHFLRKHRLKQSNMDITAVEDPNSLSRQQLQSFALQISQGMEYLALRNCIHRDLAARNILVSENHIMKISDFGMARDVLDNEYYRQKIPGKVPVRWMAPESIEYRYYNSQTDVWSFGVLLWEIMTFGDYPYKDWEHFFSELKNGRRLEQPISCSEEIYQLMRKCWQLKANERPSFCEIVKNLERIKD